LDVVHIPQIQGLGYSPIAQKFAISSLQEAKAYLDHPILGARLRECCRLVTQLEGRSIEEIFGYPDDLKFRSSMTLFAKPRLRISSSGTPWKVLQRRV